MDRNKDKSKIAISLSKNSYHKLLSIQERLGADSVSDALIAVVLLAHTLIEDNTVEIEVREE